MWALQHQSNTAVVASQFNSFMMCDLVKPPVGIVPFFTEVIVKRQCSSWTDALCWIYVVSVELLG